MRGHTNASECLIMADIFSSLGYRVEIIDRRNTWHKPPSDVVMAIDIQRNLERWDLPNGAIKILHATGAHWLFANRAELHRLNELRIRQGIALRPRRQADPTCAPEVADHIVVLGNKFTEETYGFIGKPITRIPISSAYEFSFPENKNYENARKRFLWVGSYGMVHKGLDLVLEAFSQMPDLELTICGRPEKENDFFSLYKKELTHAPNIHFHGWVDMASPDFAEIARTHASVVYPSCSEGGAGSVIHCMHAGLIPICTRESSIDLEAFGVRINEGTVSAVKKSVRSLASMASREIEDRSRSCWKSVREKHSAVHFRKNYAEFAAELIE